jgi:hypothetical protein
MSKAKQYHFVVMYDTETKSWSTSPDVSINFDNGDVWNEETQEWEFNILETEEADEITNAIGKIMSESPSVDY